ncbi:hypothetical protein [Neobacillus vireti]|uniref:hypothetical protein n=1 Tax=Neobacillus vireti TaxID=220686 RepID=UPI002FFEEF2B
MSKIEKFIKLGLIRTRKAKNKLAQRGGEARSQSFSSLRVIGEYDIYHGLHMTAMD